MKTKTQKHTPGPKFVQEHIRDIRKSTFQDSEPALVDINSPRALVQCNGSGHLEGIEWMLRQPLYAAASDLLKAAKEAEKVLDLHTLWPEIEIWAKREGRTGLLKRFQKALDIQYAAIAKTEPCTASCANGTDCDGCHREIADTPKKKGPGRWD